MDKNVYRERTVEVDGATYCKMKRVELDKECGIGKMMVYDALFMGR